MLIECLVLTTCTFLGVSNLGMVFCAHLLCVHGWVPISSFLGPWSVGHKELRSGCSIVFFSRKAKIGSPFLRRGAMDTNTFMLLFSIHVYIVTSTSLYFRLVFFSSCVVRLLNLIFLARFLCYRGLLYLSLLWEFVSWEGLVGFWSDGWAGVGGLVGVEEGKTG